MRADGFEKLVAISRDIAKRLDAAYASGERTAAVKVKQIRTADCVVGGFRYATGARVIGSLLLGLYDNEACCITPDLSPASKLQNAAH